MRLFLLFLMVVFFNGILHSQTVFSNFFNSSDGFNTCHFIKELPNNKYVFEYVREKGKGNTKFFVVNSEGKIEKWIELDQAIVLFSTFENNKDFFILASNKDKSESKSSMLYSIKINSNFDELEMVDSVKLVGNRIQTHNPKVIDVKSKSYVITTLVLEPKIGFRNYILKLDEYGNFIYKKNIESIDNRPIGKIQSIPKTNFLLVTSGFNYYICDSTYSIINKGQFIFIENNELKSSDDTVFDFMSDTSVLFLGYNVKNGHRDLFLSEGQISNDDLYDLRRLKSVYPSDTSTWDHTGVIRDADNNVYFGFLKGFLEKGSFKHLKSNSIIIQKYSPNLDSIWTFEYAYKNALFHLFDFQIVSDGGILVYGFVENYNGDGIITGYYLKLSPEGKIISQTTFPLQTEQQVNIYPNPTKGNIFLDSDYKREIQFTLYNTLGQKVFSKETKMDKTKIDIPNALPRGNYFYQIQNRSDDFLNSGKLILE